MNATRLAWMLSQEFDRDKWGSIDPELFRLVGDEEDEEPEPEDGDDVEATWPRALRKVLERVSQRINEESDV